MVEFGVGIFAPILAGVLLQVIDVTGIIAIDLVTLVIGSLFLLVAFIPERYPACICGHDYFPDPSGTGC